MCDADCTPGREPRSVAASFTVQSRLLALSVLGWISSRWKRPKIVVAEFLWADGCCLLIAYRTPEAVTRDLTDYFTTF